MEKIIINIRNDQAIDVAYAERSDKLFDIPYDGTWVVMDFHTFDGIDLAYAFIDKNYPNIPVEI